MTVNLFPASATPISTKLIVDPTDTTCPMTVAPGGEEQPCGKTVTGWRLFTADGEAWLCRTCPRHSRKADAEIAHYFAWQEYGA